MMDPTGRGDEPQVRTTVASRARRDSARQLRKVRSTTPSTFSIGDFRSGIGYRLALTAVAVGSGLEIAPRKKLPVECHAAHHAPAGDMVFSYAAT
jgi:hypothetical protein